MVAAELGLPYAFASHFAPELLISALQIYRDRFKPSEQLDRPYAMVGVNIIVAGSDDAVGLAAAVLIVVLFTAYFTVNLILRPFENHRELPS